MKVVALERPTILREEEFLAAVRSSRKLHRGWVAPPDSKDKYRRYLDALRNANREAFLVVATDSDSLHQALLPQSQAASPRSERAT